MTLTGSRIAIWLLVIGLLGASPLAGQEVSTSITYMPDMQEFEPTPLHRTIYEMMEHCTGKTGDFEVVRWYTAASIWNTDGSEYWGIWFDGWGWPAIVLDRQKVFNGEFVSHEVMHDLYKGQGPMDTYRSCVLDWENLTPIIRINTEEQADENQTNLREGRGPTVKPETGRSGSAESV